jgi:hypothetical protein
MKFFNTSGPMKPDIHYCLPPLSRMDKDHITSLIAQQKYFVLHAPRQTGKTSCMPDKVIAEGLRQTADYADRCDADEAHLLVFDRRPKRRWSDRIYRRAKKHQGRAITLWGL